MEVKADEESNPRIAPLEDAIKDLQERLDTLSVARNQAGMDLDAANGRIRTLETTGNQLRAALEQALSKFEKAEAELELVTNRLEKAETELKAKKAKTEVKSEPKTES